MDGFYMKVSALLPIIISGDPALKKVRGIFYLRECNLQVTRSYALGNSECHFMRYQKILYRLDPLKFITHGLAKKKITGDV
jgi:hypothetical protein